MVLRFWILGSTIAWEPVQGYFKFSFDEMRVSI
jgi:hypothetical protein